MLIPTKQLNNTQLNHLNALIALCHTQDGHVLPVYPHILSQSRQKPTSILYYEQNELVGFIGAYYFYPQAVEVSLMIAPQHRRKKLATQLIKTLMTILSSDPLHSLIFSTLPKPHSDWLASFKFSYVESEYEMQRKSQEKVLHLNPRLTIQKALSSDIADLCVIDKACFPNNAQSMESHFQDLITNPNYQLLIAHKHDTPIGKAHIHWQEDGAKLSDIAILPEFQGQGLGQELIGFCINHALKVNQPTISLDVQTNNLNAIKLYTRLGFETTNRTDYWQVPITTLKQALNQGIVEDSHH